MSLSNVVGTPFDVSGVTFPENVIVRAAQGPRLPALRPGTGPQPFDPLPPFGTNVPITRPLTSADTDITERLISSDPREQWYLALPSKLTPNQVEMIKRSASGGDIWQFFQFTQLMTDTWPMYAKCVGELCEAVSNVKFVVTPYAENGQEPSETATLKANQVRRNLHQMRPNPFSDERNVNGTIYQQASAFVNGIVMQELIWDQPRRVTGGHYSRMIRSTAFVHPRHFTFADDGALAIFDDMYNRLTFSLANPGQSPNPDKFLCGQYYHTSGTALTAARARPLGWYWCSLVFGREWMLNTAKNFGSPFIDIEFAQNTDLVRLKEFLANSGPNRQLLHPQGTTANIHPASSLGPDNPQRYLAEEADKQCQLLILGQTLTSDLNKQGGGARALGEVHMEVRQDRVMAISKWLAHGPLIQIASAICRRNFGNDDELPSIEPDFSMPLTATEAGQFLVNVSSSKVPLRADEVYRRVGHSIPRPGETIIQEGQVLIMGEPKEQGAIEDEEHQREVELKKTAPPKPKVPAKTVKASSLVRNLLTCSDNALAEIEALVRAAESAPHPNGELTALNDRLNEFEEETNRI